MSDDTPSGGTGGTTAPPAPDHGGPRVTGEQVRDVNRLRRVRQGRTIAGVSNGLARHLDVDPTVIKVLFVVLSFFGGAGLLLYGALWMLVPNEGEDRAIVHTGTETRKWLIIMAGVVVGLMVLGQGWGGWWFGPLTPISLVVVAAVVYLLTRDQRRQVPPTDPVTAAAYAAPIATYAPLPDAPSTYATPPPDATSPYAPPPDAPSPYAPSPYGPTPYAPVEHAGAARTGSVGGDGNPSTRPAWAPPPYVPPTQRRPRRRGILLFFPTLGLIAVALGAVGAYDADHVVDGAAYPALALGVTGAMLVVGAFRGRAGGLPLVGVVTAMVLAVTSVTGGFNEARRTTYDPSLSAEVRPAYDMQTGELVLNLSNLTDVAALDGRSIRIDGRTGAVLVIVPRNLRVDVRSKVQVVGGITIGPDNQTGGLSPSAEGTFSGGPDTPELNLDIDIRVGQITVRNDHE